MPIVWRKSIRQKKAAKSNPIAAVFGALQSGIQAALDAALTVVTFPLRAVGAVKDGGPKAAAAAAVVVAAVVLLLLKTGKLFLGLGTGARNLPLVLILSVILMLATESWRF